MDLAVIRSFQELLGDHVNDDLSLALESWTMLFTGETSVLEKGSIRLDGVMADDLSVVNSARVSFGKHTTSMTTADEKLVGFLMRQRHGSPFEHNVFRFHVVAPIFVFREWMRHRIASYNEFSGRYSEFNPEFYIPLMGDVRTHIGKPGNYSFQAADEEIAANFMQDLEEWVERGATLYNKHMIAGVAKEQARFFIANNVFSEMYFTVNARSLMNFISLRNHKDAQMEIRVYADALEHHFETFMPATYDFFLANGRVSP